MIPYQRLVVVLSGFDKVIGDFNTTWDFLDLNGHPLPKAKNPRYIIQLQQLRVNPTKVRKVS
jgi:hypothetical protein